MIKVFLICSGLGNVARGYESFTRECFEALSGHPELQITLFKGAGESSDREITLWNLPRNSRIGKHLTKLTGKSSYYIEQYTFGLSLLRHIVARKPDVIYFSDVNVGNCLYHFKRLTHGKFKLLFSNGSPYWPPFPRFDHIQQLAPVHLEEALQAGQSAESQTLLPYGAHMKPELPKLTQTERCKLRQRLGLPEDRPILLSVGAVNKGHKRMDYVVKELAALSAPRPYLVMLGQTDSETPEIRSLAESLLGADGFRIQMVPHSEIANYYQAADIFVLASLQEGLPRVLIEAQSFGLPCLAHDYDLARFALDNDGLFGNFKEAGALTDALCRALSWRSGEQARERRHLSCYTRYSWDRLGARYVEMIKRCANS